MNKILVILQKEWLEIRQQRVLMLGVLLPPLLFTLIPLGIIYLSGSLASNSSLSSPSKSFPGPSFAGMTVAEQGQAVLGSQFSIFYVLLPVLITSIIASYSIVGEKTSRTLEPLLATPVRTWELLLGKCLAALIPGFVITWMSGVLFVIGTAAFAVSGRVFAAIVSPGWLVVSWYRLYLEYSCRTVGSGCSVDLGRLALVPTRSNPHTLEVISRFYAKYPCSS